MYINYLLLHFPLNLFRKLLTKMYESYENVLGAWTIDGQRCPAGFVVVLKQFH